MIDLKLLRENPDKVTKGAKDKGVDVDIKVVVKLEEQTRRLNSDVQELQAKKNSAAKEQNKEEGKRIKEELKGKEQKLQELSEKLKEELYKIPNLPADDVSVGKDESE